MVEHRFYTKYLIQYKHFCIYFVFIIFSDFGVSQFVCGFGIPVDLNLETVTSGIVFKSQLSLPSKPEDLRNHTVHKVHGRKINKLSDQPLLTNLRWSLYKTLELWASKYVRYKLVSSSEYTIKFVLIALV